MNVIPSFLRRDSELKKSEKFRGWMKRNVGIDPWYFLFRPNNVATGEFLTEDDALKVSTIYRCVALLSQGVATLPCLLYENRKDGGKNRAAGHPYYKMLLYKPNHFQDSVQFFEQIMISLCLRGNAYIQKVMTVGGTVAEFVPLLPDYMRVKGNSSGLTYEYRQPLDQQTRILTPDQVIHIRALPRNGILGISPIEKAMEAVGMAIAAEKFGAAFFANGVTPSGILQHPGSLGDEAYNRLKEEFNKKQSDQGKKHGTLILEEGMKWEPMGITNEQAQFIQTRRFTVEDIGRWFGVPLHMLGASDRQTAGSIEQLGLEFLTHSLRPWMVRIELAFLTQVFSESDYDKYSVEFLADAMLRADTMGRYNSYVSGINNGFLSIDEARAKENLNPLPEGLGNQYFRPLNMAALGSEPSKEPIPGAPTTTAGTTGYAPGTPAAQDVVDANLDSGRSLVELDPIIKWVMERVERRAERIRQNGKDIKDPKFRSELENDLTPILESACKILNKKIERSKVFDSVVEYFYAGDKVPNWSGVISEIVLN